MNKFIAIVLLLILAFSCTENKNDTAGTIQSHSFDVIAHLNSDPDGLHPFNNISGGMAYIFEYVHRKLVRVDLETLELVPDIASAKARTNDNKAFRYNLKSGVQFDEDNPVNSNDVKFTMLIAMCPLTNNHQKKTSLNSIVDSIEVISNEEFVYHTNKVYAGANYIWSDLPIISAKFYDPKGYFDTLSFQDVKNPDYQYTQEQIDWFEKFNGRDYSHKPENIHGLGAYKITQWEEGQKIILEKKKGWGNTEALSSVYSDGNPSKLIFKIISDEQTAKQALINGEIDISNNISSEQAYQLGKNKEFLKDYEIERVPILGVTLIAINSQPMKFDRAPGLAYNNVRRAINLVTPYDAILEQIHGMGTRQSSIVSPAKPYYDEKLLIETNANKAIELLEKSGWIDSDGDGIRDKNIKGKIEKLSFEIGFMENPSFRAMTDNLKDAFLEIGIELIPKPTEPQAMYGILMSRDFDLFLTSLTGSGGFDDLSEMLHTDQKKINGMNFTSFGSSKTDSILNEINLTMDAKKQNELYRTIQKEFNDAATFVILYAVERKLVISKKFKPVKVYSEKPSILLHKLQLK